MSPRTQFPVRLAWIATALLTAMLLGCNSGVDSATSGDGECFAEMEIQQCNCRWEFYYNCDSVDAGGGVAYNDSYGDCLGEAWSAMIECAEPSGCLDDYIHCMGMADDTLDWDWCHDDLDECAYWYHQPCIEACYQAFSECEVELGSDKCDCVASLCDCTSSCFIL